VSTDSSALQASLLPQISIIIPVYNGAHIISRLLDSIQQLDYPPDRYEVLVVDNNSTDDSEGAVAAYPVKVLHERAVQSSYAARNLGIRQARGEILAFTDADCLVHPRWLRRLQAAFHDPAVGGAAGDIQGVEPARSWVEAVLNRRHHMSPIDRRHSSNGVGPKLKQSFKRPSRRLPRLLKRLGLVTYGGDSRLPTLPIAPTANVAYRREVFEQVGCFDDTFFGGGDTEFAIRMQQQSNLKLVAVPEAVVYHRHRASLRQLWRAYARYEIGDVMLIEKFLGLDDGVQRQLVVESLAYLVIGVPWLFAKLVFRALRSALIGPPYPLYIQDIIVGLVTLMSRHLTRIKACNLLRPGLRGELWIP
jgi:cellulose synthase/poly-beta-1,6-N-acetylglucosamine synthase-like glycosyltransferase